jgi:hypothetical protein
MSKEFIQYEHHGAEVFVRAEDQGKHRLHCLCFRCNRFKPGAEDNCPLAQALYQLCVQNDMVTPVWECPAFDETLSDERAQS